MSSSTTKSVPPLPSALSSLISSSGAKSASEALAISVLHNLQYQHNWTDLKLHLVYTNHTQQAPTGRSELALVDLEGLHFNHSNSSSRTVSPSRSTSSSGSTTPTLIEASLPNGSSTPLSLPASIPLISGLPPQHSYIHPDLQTHLIKHKIKETEIPVQRDFVLPLALGEKWTLSRFCTVFDSLSEREAVRVQRPGNEANVRGQGNGSARANGRASGQGSSYEHKDQKRVLLGMRANEGMGGDGTIVYYIMQEGEVKPRQNG
ncbi:hypothetical protein H2200_005757 [Cladophialophora chaetospira]|uniref:tRNA-splicing endonuclease subunit Sen15 domain-containing protein n=1 Tax=Cladophialophora chaetospira TaxID=386627 RepID=A0AA38XA79_9EURO|nr:hypothetical protein H2200_005757 [Cladophialophora chaetospira]